MALIVLSARPWWASLVVASVGSAPALVGCQSVPDREWELVFTTREGEIVLVTLSTTDLFTGKAKPRTRELVKTRAHCKEASWDPVSGRTATLEHQDFGCVVRVYDRESTVLFEYPLDCALAYPPRLDAGGAHVAFFCRRGAICIGKVGRVAGDAAVRVWHLPMREGPRLDRLACFWTSGHSLAVGVGAQIYEVAVDDGQARSLTGGRLLCGVVGESVVATRADWSILYTFCDAATGKPMGRARSGHSYASLEGISPCGGYVAYIVPGAFWSKGRYYIHHLDSGLRAVLRVPARWSLGSWHETDEMRE